jgi:UDP-4-amino-4-deoxy-L-arabinose-oxoglutarate aminotransferase
MVVEAILPMMERLSLVKHSKPWIAETDLRCVEEVLSSGMIAQGDQVRKFEEEVSEYIRALGGVAVGSGTAALILALLGIGVGLGSEVILPSYVCSNVLDAVKCVGANPVLCDVGELWNMTPETVASRITKKTAAIIAVHIYGIPIRVAELAFLGPPVVENCSQAFGVRQDGAIAGTNGVVGIFSFNATKCLTSGEGGMVVTTDPKLLEKMYRIRDGGLSLPFRLASPMTDIQAALGRSQLARYSEFLSSRREIAQRYFSELEKIQIILPERVKERSIFFRFPIRVHGDIETYQRYFEEKGIMIRRGVDSLLHHRLGLDPSLFPMTEILFSETVSLPIYPALTNDEQTAVIKTCREIWSDRGNSY